MIVVTEVLEKAVGIDWRTLAVPFVAFSCSSQSFWLNNTSESWGDWGSKRDLFLDNHLSVLSYSYSRCGLQTKHFISWWVNFFAFAIHKYVPFLLFACAGLVMSKGYLVFNIMKYYKDMFTWRYQTCHTATLTCQNWAIIMKQTHTL